jgi:hypothetical protein
MTNIFQEPETGTVYMMVWQTVKAMFLLTYWNRVWTFQEAVLAQRLIVAYSTQSLKFHELAIAFDRLRTLVTGSYGNDVSAHFLKADGLRRVWHALQYAVPRLNTIAVGEYHGKELSRA